MTYTYAIVITFKICILSVHLCVGAGEWKPEEEVRKLELQPIVSHLMRVLGPIRSSGRAGGDIKHSSASVSFLRVFLAR